MNFYCFIIIILIDFKRYLYIFYYEINIIGPILSFFKETLYVNNLELINTLHFLHLLSIFWQYYSVILY
jgi:hypothetical protein